MHFDTRLIAVYDATDFVIAADPEVVARPRVPNAAVDALLEARDAATAAIITAWNPASEARPREENDAAQAELVAAVAELGYAWLPAEGRGQGDWPPEASLCIFDISLKEADALARRFGQNAILWMVAGKPPTIFITAPMGSRQEPWVLAPMTEMEAAGRMLALRDRMRKREE